MKYVKTFELFAATDAEVAKAAEPLPFKGTRIDAGDGRISFFDNTWRRFLPDTMVIVDNTGPYGSDYGRWTLKMNEFVINNELIQFDYIQHTPEERFNGDVTADGEPDTLSFDFFVVKKNDGAQSDGNLRIDIEINYGESVVADFTIEQPNKIEVVSKYPHHPNIDTKVFYYLSSESTKDFVDVINRFGFEFDYDDFMFLDERSLKK